MSNSLLLKLVAAHKRGSPTGIYSICSCHPHVLQAAVQQALADGSPLLVESTCNQVNQEGGYSGMTPAQFRAYVQDITGRLGFPRARLILGGDHLGPSPWQDEPAERAMDKARVLVRDCVLAGYEKIHLDASMRCAGDPPGPGLDPTLSASRTATLCLAAEQARASAPSALPAACYVIGTEVPLPGGAQEEETALTVTTPRDARETIELTEAAFRQAGLDAAWERVIALVVQPGVEFGNDSLFEYDREAAASLSRFIDAYDQLVYEAHSTDYQSCEALKLLVQDHFAILKVGPALTFAFREAVYALSMIEREWLSMREGVQLSDIQQVLDRAMLDTPLYWRRYYTGSGVDMQFARRYSYSDRCRYYWPDPRVQSALDRLIENLEIGPIPHTLLSQFLPLQYERVRGGVLPNAPRAFILDKIRAVLASYARACGVGD